MSPARPPRQQHLRQRIAAAAARIMAEDGVDNYALAKRKAARQLGVEESQALPANGEVEAELRLYHALYQKEEHAQRLHLLRSRALSLMRLLAPFRPYLTGAALSGTAVRYAELDIQVFTDDAKAVELFLLDRGHHYEVAQERRYTGDQARLVPVLELDAGGVPAHVAIHPANDERGAIRATLAGKPMERAGLATVEQLLEGGIA